MNIKKCTRCHLYKTRRNVVVGRGSIPADILFIGEAPGRTEDVTGEPFTGQAGKLLQRMLNEAGLGNRSYYITNTVLCHPTDRKGGSNREPTPQEIICCRRNVLRIVEKVSPDTIVLIGKVAQKAFNKEFRHSINLIHPAYLLRQGGTASPFYQTAIQILKGVANEDTYTF